MWDGRVRPSALLVYGLTTVVQNCLALHWLWPLSKADVVTAYSVAHATDAWDGPAWQTVLARTSGNRALPCRGREYPPHQQSSQTTSTSSVANHSRHTSSAAEQQITNKQTPESSAANKQTNAAADGDEPVRSALRWIALRWIAAEESRCTS